MKKKVLKYLVKCLVSRCPLTSVIMTIIIREPQWRQPKDETQRRETRRAGKNPEGWRILERRPERLELGRLSSLHQSKKG